MARVLPASLILCAIVLATGSIASATDFTVPAGWQGVWDITDTTRDCGTTGGIQVMESDTLCTGDPLFESEPGQPTFECTGTVTDTDIDVVCTYTETISEIPGCTVTFTLTTQGTRTGDSYAATQTAMFDYSDECGLPDWCQETLTTGTRTGLDPNCTVVPISQMTWSAIKSVYR